MLSIWSIYWSFLAFGFFVDIFGQQKWLSDPSSLVIYSVLMVFFGNGLMLLSALSYKEMNGISRLSSWLGCLAVSLVLVGLIYRLCDYWLIEVIG